MPIRLPQQFPAATQLDAEGIEVLHFDRAVSQDIRPLKVVLFNLMPTKIDTEVQLLRLLSRSSIQIEAYFLRASTHVPKHDSAHLNHFYVNFDDIKDQRFDAIIFTGAPVEQLDFEEVDYWDEFKKVVQWASDNVFAELFICWGAQAGLYSEFGIQKQMLKDKLFGAYPHSIVATHQFTRGFDDTVYIPQSRHSDVDITGLQKVINEGKLLELVSSYALGPNILTTPHGHKTYVLGHLEYDRGTLENEYKRDVSQGLNTDVPKNYYPEDNPKLEPLMSWKAHANLFFVNWINYVYQETPFDLNKLSPCKF
ncbi:homoserine O-succinyltransferase [Actinomycetota bacterium]|nr:homoserine O-succinyltransferase [Actinomycetota bacterium]